MKAVTVDNNINKSQQFSHGITRRKLEKLTSKPL